MENIKNISLFVSLKNTFSNYKFKTHLKMKNTLLPFLFLYLLVQCAFAQNDKMIIGKWKLADIIPPTEQLKKMTSEQKKQMDEMKKVITKNSYFEFADKETIKVLMDIGFGNPETATSSYSFTDAKKNIVHIKATEAGKTPSITESKMKIDKISKSELVLVSTEEKTKGMVMKFARMK